MIHELPQLPYAMNALEPYISVKTLEFHYGKHHQAYVTNLNNLAKGTGFEGLSLEETIQKSHTDKNMPIFNNAAQVWNHTFYWHCMKPNGGGLPTGELATRIDADFGGFENFKEEFKQAAITQFGSGWAWLVLKDGKLSIMKTGNADLPMVHGAVALLTCDVWEHAYYIDYQNLRAKYVD
ncbi:MAG: superoxide dismutase, partial [Alphaproteobacteria bacterium]|nr:superoxide dismutase [Alphaproteobacteria bacterium]